MHRIGRTGRAGKKGLATAFFTEKDGNLARGLIELMQEADQEVPSFLHGFSSRAGSAAVADAAAGGNRFGGRDYRSGGGAAAATGVGAATAAAAGAGAAAAAAAVAATWVVVAVATVAAVADVPPGIKDGPVTLVPPPRRG